MFISISNIRIVAINYSHAQSHHTTYLSITLHALIQASHGASRIDHLLMLLEESAA